MFRIPEDRKYNLNEWSIQKIKSMSPNELEDIFYGVYIFKNCDAEESDRPGIIIDGRKQCESFKICGKHRYIRYGYDKDYYTTIDFSGKLFDIKIDVLRGWIYTNGFCMSIPDNKKFNEVVVSLIWADYMYDKLEFSPKKIVCEKYIPSATINIPINENYEFVIKGMSYVEYDLNYDTLQFGKADLHFVTQRNLWYDFDRTSISDLTNNETGFVGFKTKNATTRGFHYRTFVPQMLKYESQEKLFGTRNEFAIICGNPNLKTIYVFKDNDITACWEFVVNTLSEYYLLGNWLTMAAIAINGEYITKYNDNVFVSHPTNLTSEYGKPINDSIYVRNGNIEERVILNSGRYKRSIIEINEERERISKDLEKLPSVRNTKYPINEISIDSKFDYFKSSEFWDIIQTEYLLSERGVPVTIIKEGENVQAYDLTFSIRYRTISYRLEDSFMAPEIKIQYLGKLFNPKSDHNLGIVSIGKYDFVFENCYHYNFFIALVKEADEQFLRIKNIRDSNIQMNSRSKLEAQKKSKEELYERGEVTPMIELDRLIGLEGLKNDVRELINLVKMQQVRQARGLKSVPVSLHLVFTGNPGTGKTTVARILAKIYKEIGILSKGQLIEVDRAGLVAGYVGQTALKTQDKINEAKGGILFIDEAYTLVREGNDYGQEAIDTILKAMEDNRDDLVVIVAGYPELMSRFISSNPGLKSRFNKYFYFPDYEEDELEAIFYSMCTKYDYLLDNSAKEKVKKHLEKICLTKDENFANARDVRNFFEKIVANQATRVLSIHEANQEEMITIKAEDIE